MPVQKEDAAVISPVRVNGPLGSARSAWQRASLPRWVTEGEGKMISRVVCVAVIGLMLGAVTGVAGESGKEKAAVEEKEIEVRLTVPDSAWEITIDSVHLVNKEIWVVSTVSRHPDVMGAQVISTVRASVKISAGDLPVKHFVIGKAWGWKNKEVCTFIKDLKQIEKDLSSGKLLYKRAS